GDPAVRRYKLTAPYIDTHGCPIYDPANTTNYFKSDIVTGGESQTDLRVMRAYYVPSTDTMYFGVYSEANKKISESVCQPNCEFGMVGSELRRYDHWANPSQRARVWTTALPYGPFQPPPAHAAQAMDVAGGRVYAVMSDTREVLAYDATAGT